MTGLCTMDYVLCGMIILVSWTAGYLPLSSTQPLVLRTFPGSIIHSFLPGLALSLLRCPPPFLPLCLSLKFSPSSLSLSFLTSVYSRRHCRLILRSGRLQRLRPLFELLLFFLSGLSGSTFILLTGEKRSISSSIIDSLIH